MSILALGLATVRAGLKLQASSPDQFRPPAQRSIDGRMPRLSPAYLNHALNENPLLPLLLRACRDLPPARNELRWLREHVKHSSRQPRLSTNGIDRLKRLCISRSRGKPLQYILGSQPFGELDIKCRSGVLIPRPETEAYTTSLAASLIHLYRGHPLHILDLCTGTGCIALLLHALLAPYFPILSVHGIDISSRAIALANQNKGLNIAKGHLLPSASAQVHFSHGDIFAPDGLPDENWDVIVANPPYISPRGFDRETERSVRRFEPREALVPKWGLVRLNDGRDTTDGDMAVGDAFYPRLLEISQQLEAKCVIMEVADMEQAKRVIGRAIKMGWGSKCDIWRDWPEGGKGKSEVVEVERKTVRVRGEGNGRAVVLWR